ncbi:flippase [Variovorax arabinosiphilus]|uniref:flippase n=1 Tax=Variovorax arabinosiphilus TaxID=3053498 RepID=UPI00257905DB|nr:MULTISPECIES: flippase [unclassified Variovorax]MDM0121764.1 flippase [Variovorax sp. J2L1-78]MDM0130825.1 flippase [Variovorax sp. J2L1-63]MDM0234527.1 flippase [Variovorax sp. J2R1-6]
MPNFWNGMRTDTLWQLAERGLRAGLGFALSILIARTLGPVDFGLYSYALATIALFAFLGQAGLESLVIRELVRDPKRVVPILNGSLYLRSGGAVCAALGSIGAAMLFAPTETQSAVLIVCILSLSGLLQAGWVIESLLLANREFAEVAKTKILAYGFAAGLRVVALLLPSPLVYLAVATVLESLLCLVLLWRASHRQFAIGWSSVDKPDFKQIAALARLAMPMLLSAFTVAMYSRIDVFMLGRMLGYEAAGLYTAGTLLSEGFYLFPMAVMAAAGPRLAQLFMHDQAAFAHELHRVLRILSAIGLGIALAVTFLAPLVLPRLFGSTYAMASPVLQIHIWSTWAVFVSAVSDAYYINHDLRRLYLLKTAVAAIVNIGVNLVLIPRLGPVGAAWATLVAYSSSAIFFGALSPTTRPLFKMQLRAIMGIPSPHRIARSTKE